MDDERVGIKAPDYPILARVVGLFSVMASIAFCLLVWAVIAELEQQFPFLKLYSFVYHFQTLISGAFALLVGFLTVWYIRKQIKQTEKERDDRISRKSKATRATMSFALSSLCDYSEEYLEYASMLHARANKLDDPPPIHRDEGANQELANAAKKITLPTNALDLLIQCVEYADEEWSSIFANLLSELQVIEARLDDDRGGGLKFRPRLSRVAEDRARDAARLYGMASQLFPYARFEIQKPSELKQIDQELLFRLRRDLDFSRAAS